ncbi:MAG: hypothetical protein ACRCV9_00425 [Burkholderiaceae bacterium]
MFKDARNRKHFICDSGCIYEISRVAEKHVAEWLAEKLEALVLKARLQTSDRIFVISMRFDDNGNYQLFGEFEPIKELVRP